MEPYLGEIKMFVINYAPRNWAFCEGQLMAVTDNDALFSLIGSTYGGDGRTNFQLPDMRGRVAMHMGASPYTGGVNMPLGAKGGVEGVTLTVDQLPQHRHTLRANNGSANDASPNATLLAGAKTDDGTEIPAYASASANANKLVEMEDQTTVAGSSLSHMNIQPSLVLNFCIALAGVYPSRS